jgi:hypothetical protein
MSASAPSDAIYSPPDGFVESLLHHAGTPRSQYPEPPQSEVAQPVQQPQAPAPASPQTPSEPKTRLRKACDSCSARKVKVRNVLRDRNTARESSANTMGVLCSVTNLAHLVAHAPPLTYHVHSNVLVEDEDRQTNMQKLSKDNDWNKMALGLPAPCLLQKMLHIA